MKGNLFVLFQLGFVFILILENGLIASSFFPILLQSFAAILGIWSLLIFPPKMFRINPVPAKEGKVLNRGPYSLIRHPMYVCVLAYCAAFVIETSSWSNGLFFLLLSITLVFKLHFEEKMLKAKYSDYVNYMGNSYRLIPFIY